MHSFKITPDSLFRGRGCPKCANNVKKTTEQYKTELLETTKGEYELRSKYKNNQTDVIILHKKCGNEYPVKPLNFTKGRRCPFCVRTGTTEKHIFKMLKSIYGEKARPQVYFEDLVSDSGVYLRYDISLNLSGKTYLIEYNGEQHYKPMRYRNAMKKFMLTQKHDKMKRSYAFKHGYVYVEIPYDKDWEAILRDYGIRVKI